MRTISGIMLVLLLVTMLSVAFNVRQVRSDWTWTETIYIRADGSIDPPDGPISTLDNVTYTLTGDITSDVGVNGIVVERNNTVVDGAGYTLQTPDGNGFSLSRVSNVTIKNTNIDNSGYSDKGYGIYLYSSSDSVLLGNNIMANNNHGICLNYSSRNVLVGNNVTADEDILLSISDNNTLSDNNFMLYGGYCTGITIVGSSSGNVLSDNNVIGNGAYSSGITICSSGNVLSGNNVTGTFFGFSLYSSGNVLSGNVIAGNGYNFGVSGNVLSDFVNYIDTSNLVCGKPVYYMVGQSNIVISPQTCPDGVGYLGLVNCTNVTVQGLTITHNMQGLLLVNTSDSRIIGNEVTANNVGISLSTSCANDTLSDNNVTANSGYRFGVGIGLSSSSRNVLVGNNVTANIGFGIVLDSSFDNSIVGNNITNNYYGTVLYSSSGNSISDNNITHNWPYIYLVSNVCGIYLDSSSDNSIFHNNFVNNTVQVFSSNSTNIWDDGYPSGGNYWSDYSDFDFYSGPYQNETGSDEIWDHPYVIDENNTDNYPIASGFPSILILSPENRTYNVGNISLTFTVDRTVSWIGYGLDGQANMTVSGNTTLTDLSEGLHRIAIYANDSTGDMGASNTEYFTIDMTPPTIGTPNQSPSSPVDLGQEVKVSVNVTDASSGVKNVTLLYTITNGSSWETPTSMSYNLTTNLYETTISGQPDGTVVKYKIVAYDNAGNERIDDDLGEYYVYSVIPEFPSFLVLPLFVMATLLAVIIYGRKHAKKR